MQKYTSYCEYVSTLSDTHDVDKQYHDHVYGVPVSDDNELFGRLVMEINQAGLSWRTILLKEQGFRRAYHNFSIVRVAAYKERDVERLLADASIIRNRLKVGAAIYNAKQILLIQKEHGTFARWLTLMANDLGDDYEAWVTLFKKQFKFVGGEIVKEFLMSIGLTSGAHVKSCKRYSVLV